MTILWYGQSCFQILTSQGKNGQISIVIDPFDETTGLKFPKIEADILLITHDHNNIKGVSAPTGASPPFLISGPGEYEIKGVFIRGIPAFHDDSQGKERGKVTVYTIEAEEMRLFHLGDLGQKELTSEQLEKIGEVDVLFIPIGGVYTISAKEAIKIMSQIEPKVIIPMHYQVAKLKLKLDGLDKFLKTVGLKSIEPLKKLSIKKKDLSSEEVKIIVLKP